MVVLGGQSVHVSIGCIKMVIESVRRTLSSLYNWIAIQNSLPYLLFVPTRELL